MSFANKLTWNQWRVLEWLSRYGQRVEGVTSERVAVEFGWSRQRAIRICQQLKAKGKVTYMVVSSSGRWFLKDGVEIEPFQVERKDMTS